MDKRTKEYKALHGNYNQQDTLTVGSAASVGCDALSLLKLASIPCKYVRFHQPVPPGCDKEPVSEFKVQSGNKYSIETMLYHPISGLIFKALNKRGEIEEDIVPAANIIYVRV